MALLCICGVCIPYSALWPLLLLILKPIYDYFQKLFGKTPVKSAVIEVSSIKTETVGLPQWFKKGISQDLQDSESFSTIIAQSNTIVKFTASW